MASLERFTSCMDYEKELPANIQIVPNEELISAYETDYNETYLYTKYAGVNISS